MTEQFTIKGVSTVFKVKKDSYRRARGGNTEILDIFCSNCQSRDEALMVYQKDGPGSLLRAYLDRIHYPPHLASLAKDPNMLTVQDIPSLVCPFCHALIGVPMLYKKENRLAYRLVPGSFRKHRHS